MSDILNLELEAQLAVVTNQRDVARARAKRAEDFIRRWRAQFWDWAAIAGGPDTPWIREADAILAAPNGEE